MTPDALRKQYPGARYITTDGHGMRKVWKTKPTCGGPTGIWGSPTGEEGIPMGLTAKPDSAAASLLDIEALEAQAIKDYEASKAQAAKDAKQQEVQQQAFAGLPPPQASLSQGDRVRLLTTVVRELVVIVEQVAPAQRASLQALLDRLAVLD